MLVDIFFGVWVFESGVGLGVFLLVMLRVGVIIVGYELREDFFNWVCNNVVVFLGDVALERY